MMSASSWQAGSTPASPQYLFPIAHASDIASVRRLAVQIAHTANFDETRSGRVAIVVTEAATNILKHAGHGQILLRPLAGKDGDAHGIEVLALDKGAGIANIGRSLCDGVSSTGTAGTGLGAMRRMADTFDVYTLPGKGSAFHMVFWSDAQAAPDDAPLLCGAVCVPLPGEEQCGDGWHLQSTERRATLVVIDGLGHGPLAATAAQAAIRTARSKYPMPPTSMLDAMHQALRPTRGAAAAVADLDLDAGDVCFAGVGNISAWVLSADGGRKSLVSHNGIVGHNIRKIQQGSTPWPKGAVLVLHSDGLGTQWNLDNYPGLQMRHPSLIAGVLFRDFTRGRDDSTVVVLRRTRE